MSDVTRFPGLFQFVRLKLQKNSLRGKSSKKRKAKIKRVSAKNKGLLHGVVLSIHSIATPSRLQQRRR